MIYVILMLALIGVVAVASARQRVEAKPMCPNCRVPLENFEVERCPHCLLWQPPAADRQTYHWRPKRVWLGIGLLLLPSIAHFMLPPMVDDMLEPEISVMPPMPTTMGVPLNTTGLTAQQIAQLRALGYLPATQTTTTQPTPGGSSGQ